MRSASSRCLLRYLLLSSSSSSSTHLVPPTDDSFALQSPHKNTHERFAIFTGIFHKTKFPLPPRTNFTP
uniref:Putative secreted peptide n=1 Tax=Anopheles braziliensis TaxID=58242 RepID=A0A2M3ZX02_9DIPT